MKENQNTEWKESWRDEYLRWVCGFANAEGGVLVIGRNDQGEVSGLKDARKLLEDLPNKVRDVLGIMVDVNLRKKAGREYLEIVVPAYPNAISYRGEYFYRSGSTNQMLKGAALDRLLLRKHGRTWDGVPHPGVLLKDLNKQALATFRAQALQSGRLSSQILKEPDGALLDKLHLREGKYLTRAATLLFHPLPEQFIGGAYIKIGLFDTNADLRHQDVVSGDLLSQVSQTMDTLRLKYLKAGISYEGLQRVETFPVPDAALREAILNAVVHKDYASAIPVQISVYADKLMIWNPGHLPPDWTITRLLGKHPSEPFNPDIANAFFRAGLIESWGRGVERILQACKAAKAPVPEFRQEADGMWAVFGFGPPPPTTPITTPITTQETTPITTQKALVSIGKSTTPITTPIASADGLLDLLRANPGISQTGLAQALGLSRDGIKYHLNKLKRLAAVRRIGPARGGHWKVLK